VGCILAGNRNKPPDKKENDERGTMSDELMKASLQFIVPRSAFIVSVEGSRGLIYNLVQQNVHERRRRIYA
jgi:hypothetical protein